MDQFQKHFNKKEKIYGQYFTPQEISNFIVERCLYYLGKDISNIKAIDPACGDGSFLSALRDKGIIHFEGYDIDEEVFNLLALDFIDRVKIFNALTLDKSEEYDMAVGNPPFSSKYNRVRDKNILNRFKLGRGKNSQAIEVLFLEKFIDFLKPNGVLGIILPLGVAGASNLQDVRDFLNKKIQLKEILYLEPGIFKNNASTIIIIGIKRDNPNNDICKFGLITKLNPIEVKYIEKALDINNINPFYYFYDEDSDGVKFIDLIDEAFSGKGFYKEERKERITTERTDKIYITAKNVGWGTFLEDNILYFKGEINEKYILQKGDIVFCRVGQGTMGRCIVTDEITKGSIADDWFHIIRPKNKEYSIALCAYFLTKNFKEKIKRRCIGTGTPNISKQKLLDIKVPWSKIIKIYDKNKDKNIIELSKIMEEELT